MNQQSSGSSEVSGPCATDSSESPHRRGLHITVDTVNAIIEQVLPKEGVCRKLEEIKMGFNNKSYSITTEGGNKYVIRITKTTWAKEKVECEMVALKFVGDNTSIPVPKVIGFDSAGEKYGFMWILMEKMPGENLADAWDSFTENEQRDLVKQAVGFLKQLQEIRWPSIGGFYCETLNQHSTLTRDHIVIDKYFEKMYGPFSTSTDLAKKFLEIAIQELETKEGLEPLRSYLPKARYFADLLRKDAISLGLPEVPIVTFHGDLAFRNMLVERFGSKPVISALLDWEWAGAMPAYREWDHSSFANDSIGHHLWFQEEAERQGLLHPATIPGYDKHMALVKICEFLSPWTVGFLDSDTDKKAIDEAKVELDKLFPLFGVL